MVRTQKPLNARARGVAVLEAIVAAVTATIALQRPRPVAAQSVEDVMQEVNAAVAPAGHPPERADGDAPGGRHQLGRRVRHQPANGPSAHSSGRGTNPPRWSRPRPGHSKP